jgi:hypothetical protein
MGYIRFDVDKIKDFVFESYKPVEVTGASEMIKLLDEGGPILEKLKTHFQDPEAKVVYARGGGGLMRVSQREKEICDWLQDEYAKTVKGGKLTAVYCEAADDFPVTYALLNYKLRELKNQKALVNPPEKAVKFTQEDSRRRCSACGKRVADKGKKNFYNEVLYYCGVCETKRKKGFNFIDQKEEFEKVISFEDFLIKIPHVKDSTHLLMIYGDLNSAGDLFASTKDKEELGELSKQIFITLEDARKEMGEKLCEKKFKSLMPVAGGDDLIIFIHPAAFGLIKDTLYGLEDRMQKATEKITDRKLKMNFSLLVAKHNFPIYNLFNISEDLLKLTKKEYYKEENPGNRQTHYGFYWLEDGGFQPSEKDVYQKEEFSALYDFAFDIHGSGDISTSALHQLLDLLPVSENKKEKYQIGLEEHFNISYLLARDKALAEMLVPGEKEYRIKAKKNLQVTRDLWEDVIDMKELVSNYTKKKEAG